MQKKTQTEVYSHLTDARQYLKAVVVSYCDSQLH